MVPLGGPWFRYRYARVSGFPPTRLRYRWELVRHHLMPKA